MIRQCLNRRIDSIDILRDEVAAWQASRDLPPGQGQLAVHYPADARYQATSYSLYPTLDE